MNEKILKFLEENCTCVNARLCPLSLDQKFSCSIINPAKCPSDNIVILYIYERRGTIGIIYSRDGDNYCSAITENDLLWLDFINKTLEL